MDFTNWREILSGPNIMSDIWEVGSVNIPCFGIGTDLLV